MDQKLNSVKEVRSECEHNELPKRYIKRVIDGHLKVCTQTQRVFKKVSGFLTVNNGTLHKRNKLFEALKQTTTCLWMYCFNSFIIEPGTRFAERSVHHSASSPVEYAEKRGPNSKKN